MISHSRTKVPLARERILVLLLWVPLIFFVSCAKRSRPLRIAEQPTSTSALQRININTAPVKELEALPGIGQGLAERIVEHREKYGPFRRAEHLMMVRGISETRFRALRHLVTVE